MDTLLPLGFACKIIGEPGMNMRTCTLRNATHEKLCEVTHHNIAVLANMVAYAARMQIGLMRISSDIIPLASHPAVTFPWQDMFASQLVELGKKIMASNIRVSMHPGQYTVLNSPDKGVVERSVADLVWHAEFLDSLGMDYSAKLILHVGGAYGDKRAACSRFMQQAQLLPGNVLRRLTLENDEKNYSISEVFELCSALCIPAVMDVFHHALLPSPYGDMRHWIAACKGTWGKHDGRQKIHYSQQLAGGRRGSHSQTIIASEFMSFYQDIIDFDMDIMLEVKDKNLSTVKCGNCISTLRNKKKLLPRVLTEEWARYKYLVLEHSPAHYTQIREFLKTDHPLASEFYALIEAALSQGIETGKARTAAEHVWGYFKKEATQSEKKTFTSYLHRYDEGTLSLDALKRFLFHCSERYKKSYLLHSLYFASLPSA